MRQFLHQFSMETLNLYLPILILALHIITNRILHKLRNLPPCPFPTLPFIGHLYLLKKPFHKSLSKISYRYGPVISLRLGCVPVVLVSSPLAAEECFTKNDITFANRPTFLNGKYFGYNYTSLPWSSYGEHWRNLRRISSLEVLSSHKIQKLSDIRSDEVRLLIRKLFQVSVEDPDQLADMRSACFELTFNVVTRMITGKSYYGENVENSEEARVFHEITSESAKLNHKANVLDFLPSMRWFGLRDVEEKMREVQERRDNFMQNLIDEHRNAVGLEENKTMIGVLLALHEKEPKYYTDETIRNLMLVLIQAGSDTTANTMELALAHLIDNPEVLNKAQAEIDKHVGQERFITESDLPQLPYLRCIINETLRLHPAAPLLMPHKASQDCIVGGFRILRGTVLFVNAWDMHHNSKYWDDPEKFRPERFEGFAAGGKEETKFIPFGSGRRGCPGNNLAMHVLGLALGSLIQCFNWQAEKGKKLDMSEGLGVPVHKAQTLLAKCCPRPNMLKLLSEI